MDNHMRIVPGIAVGKSTDNRMSYIEYCVFYILLE